MAGQAVAEADQARSTVPLLLVLLLALLLFGAGFAVKILRWVAIVVLVVWLVGSWPAAPIPSGSHHRWYRW